MAYSVVANSDVESPLHAMAVTAPQPMFPTPTLAPSLNCKVFVG